MRNDVCLNMKDILPQVVKVWIGVVLCMRTRGMFGSKSSFVHCTSCSYKAANQASLVTSPELRRWPVC